MSHTGVVPTVLLSFFYKRRRVSLFPLGLTRSIPTHDCSQVYLPTPPWETRSGPGTKQPVSDSDPRLSLPPMIKDRRAPTVKKSHRTNPRSPFRSQAPPTRTLRPDPQVGDVYTETKPIPSHLGCYPSRGPLGTPPVGGHDSPQKKVNLHRDGNGRECQESLTDGQDDWSRHRLRLKTSNPLPDLHTSCGAPQHRLGALSTDLRTSPLSPHCRVRPFSVVVRSVSRVGEERDRLEKGGCTPGISGFSPLVHSMCLPTPSPLSLCLCPSLSVFSVALSAADCTSARRHPRAPRAAGHAKTGHRVGAMRSAPGEDSPCG